MEKWETAVTARIPGNLVLKIFELNSGLYSAHGCIIFSPEKARTRFPEMIYVQELPRIWEKVSFLMADNKGIICFHKKRLFPVTATMEEMDAMRQAPGMPGRTM